MPNILLCEYCADHLRNQSEKVFTLWVILCTRAIDKDGIFEIFNLFEEEIKFLEISGYIVTHEEEFEDFLKVHVRGYNFDEDYGHYFCLSSWLHSVGNA